MVGTGPRNSHGYRSIQCRMSRGATRQTPRRLEASTQVYFTNHMIGLTERQVRRRSDEQIAAIQYRDHRLATRRPLGDHVLIDRFVRRHLPGGEHVASLTTEESLKQYEAEFRFADRDYYDRHLVFDHVVTTEQADQRQRFEAMARSLRDLLTQRWLLTQSVHDRANPKQVYYLSMEFLIGRCLLSTVTNMEVQSFVDEDLRRTRTRTGTSFRKRSPTPAWATGAWAGWPPASSIHWPRWKFRRSATA